MPGSGSPAGATPDGAVVDAVVVGGGQSGLAAGYWLGRTGRSFVILDAHDTVGGAWRSRWDSLRLFTRARFNSLPGMPFPGDPRAFPTKDEMADYLAAYAQRFELPVQLKTRVVSVAAEPGGYRVVTDRGDFEAADVIVAAGGTPRVPEFAADLSPGIRQLHSARYRRPAQLADGPVLLVGAGNTGAEIARDLAGHTVHLSGRDVGWVPLVTGRGSWWLVHNHLTADGVVGRRLHLRLSRTTTPLIRTRRGHLASAGVRFVGRTTGVRDGLPVADGVALDVANVVWCTGFVRDFSWIAAAASEPAGLPAHYRGVSTGAPGLYFVGLPFQYAITSYIVGGVGRDAQYVVAHLDARTR